jgi:hypothetical protein
MKFVYKYDAVTKQLTDYQSVPDTYQLQVNETFISPEPGVTYPKFDGTTWSGLSEEEFIAQEAQNTAPSVTDQALSQLALTVAQNEVNQDKFNAQLLLANATQSTTSATDQTTQPTA